MARQPHPVRGTSSPRRQPQQIAYVVPDLIEAMRVWSEILGRDDWRVYTYGPHNTTELTYRGEPATYEMRLALCGSDPQVELIQSLRGPNIYTATQEAGGGLHHVGYFVESISRTVADLAAEGLHPVQTGAGYGLDGDGGYAYYEVPGVPGYLEFIEVPKRRRPSEPVDMPDES